MIESIEIKNFKSIYHEKVNLSPLTVLIGANGAGKSNLVKTLSFLGSIPNRGLASTVNHFGGFDTIIPRSYSTSEARKNLIELSCRFIQPPPEGYPTDLPPIATDYEISLGYNYSSDESLRFRVSKEIITFHQILSLAQVLSSENENDIDKKLLSSISSFTMSRGPRGGIKYVGLPPVKDYLDLYSYWFGISILGIRINSATQLFRVLSSFNKRRINRPDKKESRTESFLDPGISTILYFSQHFRLFTSLVSNIRRYDLLLGKLRTEQTETGEEQLANDGSNMPTILRNLRTDPSKKRSWDRILNTIETIAPHIKTVTSKQLRTGRRNTTSIGSFVGS